MRLSLFYLVPLAHGAAVGAPSDSGAAVAREAANLDTRAFTGDPPPPDNEWKSPPWTGPIIRTWPETYFKGNQTDYGNYDHLEGCTKTGPGIRSLQKSPPTMHGPGWSTFLCTFYSNSVCAGEGLLLEKGFEAFLLPFLDGKVGSFECKWQHIPIANPVEKPTGEQTYDDTVPFYLSFFTGKNYTGIKYSSTVPFKTCGKLQPLPDKMRISSIQSTPGTWPVSCTLYSAWNCTGETAVITGDVSDLGANQVQSYNCSHHPKVAISDRSAERDEVPPVQYLLAFYQKPNYWMRPFYSGQPATIDQCTSTKHVANISSVRFIKQKDKRKFQCYLYDNENCDIRDSSRVLINASQPNLKAIGFGNKVQAHRCEWVNATSSLSSRSDVDTVSEPDTVLETFNGVNYTGNSTFFVRVPDQWNRCVGAMPGTIKSVQIISSRPSIVCRLHDTPDCDSSSPYILTYDVPELKMKGKDFDVQSLQCNWHHCADVNDKDGPRSGCSEASINPRHHIVDNRQAAHTQQDKEVEAQIVPPLLCKPSTTSCDWDGKTVLVCNQHRRWEKKQTCPACCHWDRNGAGASCASNCRPGKPPKRDSGIHPPPTCHPFTTACNLNGTSVIVCNADGQWELKQTCPFCCRRDRGGAGCSSQCDPMKPPRSGPEPTKAVDVRAAQPTLRPGDNCTVPGHTMCGWDGKTILICNLYSKLQLVRRCPICCMNGNHGGEASCTDGMCPAPRGLPPTPEPLDPANISGPPIQYPIVELFPNAHFQGASELVGNWLALGPEGNHDCTPCIYYKGDQSVKVRSTKFFFDGTRPIPPNELKLWCKFYSRERCDEQSEKWWTTKNDVEDWSTTGTGLEDNIRSFSCWYGPK